MLHHDIAVNRLIGEGHDNIFCRHFALNARTTDFKRTAAHGHRVEGIALFHSIFLKFGNFNIGVVGFLLFGTGNLACIRAADILVYNGKNKLHCLKVIDIGSFIRLSNLFSHNGFAKGIIRIASEVPVPLIRLISRIGLAGLGHIILCQGVAAAGTPVARSIRQGHPLGFILS